MKNYLDSLKERLKLADSILVGAGAGLSAAGGLNYSDPELVIKLFPEYRKLGFNTIPEIQAFFWNITEASVLAYYGFWARHIWHVRYDVGPLEVYQDLYDILKEKEYFIITTNVDRQFSKSGFAEDRIFAMQGDYGLFQCQVPCSFDVYENKELIKQMVSNMTDQYHIDKKDIPFCPRCGNFLIPNLRKDNTFVETPHLKNRGRYYSYLQKLKSSNVLLLELGVGFNTPSIIRYPFDKLAAENSEKVSLARINMEDASMTGRVSDNVFPIQEDIAIVLKAMIQ